MRQLLSPTGPGSKDFKCRLNLYDSEDRMILGNALLDDYITVLDVTNNQIGMGSFNPNYAAAQEPTV